MKTLKTSALSLLLVTLFSVSTFAYSKKPETNKELKSLIKEYVSTVQTHTDKGVAEVFTNFIIEESGTRYNVDFMITDGDEVEIISKNTEFEYYRVDDRYNARFVQNYTVPVSTIK